MAKRMASVAQIKGTTVSSFTIGLKGATLYQGSDTAGVVSPKTGDLFIKTGTTPKVLQYNGASWTPLTPLPEWQTFSQNETLSANTNYFADTTANALTVTLPSSPSMGDRVTIVDGAGHFSTNNLTIAPGSSVIMGQTGKSLQISTDNATVDLVYFNSTYGWRVIDSSSFALTYV